MIPQEITAAIATKSSVGSCPVANAFTFDVPRLLALGYLQLPPTAECQDNDILQLTTAAADFFCVIDHGKGFRQRTGTTEIGTKLIVYRHKDSMPVSPVGRRAKQTKL